MRAYALAAEINPQGGGIRTAEERAVLFGQTAASVQASVGETLAPLSRSVKRLAET